MSSGRSLLHAAALSACALFVASSIASIARAQEAAPAPQQAPEVGVPEVPEGYRESVPEPPPEEIPPPPVVTVEAPPPATRVPTPAAAASESEGLRIPPRILARLHALDRDMTALSARPDTHLVDGILSMVTGGASIAFGAVYANSTSTNDAMSTYLYIYGSGSIARGLFQLTLTPTIGDDAIRYLHMPMTTVAEVRDRLSFGENALESLAGRSRTARIIDASISMATGLAFIPFYLGPRDFRFTEFLDYFVLIGASISIVSGVVTLLTRSDAERRWSAYSDLRDTLRQQREQQRNRMRADVSVVPVPGGMAIGVLGVF